MDHGDYNTLLEVQSNSIPSMDESLDGTELHPRDFPTGEIDMDDEFIDNMVSKSENPYIGHLQDLLF